MAFLSPRRRAIRRYCAARELWRARTAPGRIRPAWRATTGCLCAFCPIAAFRRFRCCPTDAGPGGDVRRRGEAAHVVTQFRQDLLGAAAGHAGHGIQPVERRLERAGVRLDPGIEEGDLAYVTGSRREQ